MALFELRLEIGLAVAADPKPVEAVEDRVDRLLGRAGLVRILDAQQILAAVMAGEQPVEQRGARAADVEIAGRRGREAGRRRLVNFAACAQRAFLLSDRCRMDWTSAPITEDAPLEPAHRRFLPRLRFPAVFRTDRRLFSNASGRNCRCGSRPRFGAGIAAWLWLPGPSQWAAFIVLSSLDWPALAWRSDAARIGRALLFGGLAMAAGCGLIWWRSELGRGAARSIGRGGDLRSADRNRRITRRRRAICG